MRAFRIVAAGVAALPSPRPLAAEAPPHDSEPGHRRVRAPGTLQSTEIPVTRPTEDRKRMCGVSTTPDSCCDPSTAGA